MPMKKALYIFPPLSALRKMAFHRRGFLRLNHIDYATGQISEKLYRFGNICFTLAGVYYFNLWIFVILMILGPVYFW